MNWKPWIEELKRQAGIGLFFATVLEQFNPRMFKGKIRDLRGWTERQMERWLMSHSLRVWVYKQYGKRCLYPGCKETNQIEIDHVISLFNGGKTEKWNLQPLCRKHNRQKGTRSIDYRK